VAHDCNANGIDDTCEALEDLDNNGIPDACETSGFTLVPHTPGPYPLGSTVDVDVVFTNREGQAIQVRLMRLDFFASDAALTLPGTFRFQLVPPLDSDAAYARFGGMSIALVEIVYTGTEPVAGLILDIPDGGSLTVGTLTVGLPLTEGSYFLDVMHATSSGTTRGAQVDYGFAPHTTLHTVYGNLFGDPLELVVTHACQTDADCDDGWACTIDTCDAAARCVYEWDPIEGSTDRNENGVPDECELGACCRPFFPFCTETTKAECDAIPGKWVLGMTCNSVPCRYGSCCSEGTGGTASCEDGFLEFECMKESRPLWSPRPCAERTCTDPAYVSVRAVAVNGESIVPSSDVVVAPGDSVEVEFYLSNWGPRIGALATWQVTLDNEAFAYWGDAGRITPRYPGDGDGYCENTGATCTDPLDCTRCLGGPNDGARCLGSSTCSGFECEYGGCVTAAESGIYFADFTCSSDSVHPGRNCQIDADCPEGTCDVRPDFVFAETEQRICAIATFAEFTAGCTLSGGSLLEVVDEGYDYYALTAVYDVSPDALGEFVLSIVMGRWSFLTNADRVDAPLGVEALAITVEPGPPTGACCDCSGRDAYMMPIPACVNGRTQAQCSGASQVWTGGVTCLEAGCSCEFQPIPTVSEWGLLLLALSLLIGGKIAFGNRIRAHDARGV